MSFLVVEIIPDFYFSAIIFTHMHFNQLAE